MYLNFSQIKSNISAHSGTSRDRSSLYRSATVLKSRSLAMDVGSADK